MFVACCIRATDTGIEKPEQLVVPTGAAISGPYVTGVTVPLFIRPALGDTRPACRPEPSRGRPAMPRTLRQHLRAQQLVFSQRNLHRF